ncbi:hypothetical protein N0B40_06760 [Chryseobacterium oranimense]|uniref:hypothetical protein n=1 Tax=Chryseobacterium oranimense TaxID=421058 RepID=UPI0021AF603E|nr:hypothetical protein [Chryseobacterium oranimense]UWX61983.1 hypothetical protein N0B40_06760 [Chryseobacterium oranimense]
MKILCIAAGLLLISSCKNDKYKTARKEPAPKDSIIVKNNPITTAATNSIEEIKKEYEMLQARLESKSFTSKGFTYDCNEEPSGEVKFYSDKDEIKIIEHFYAEHSHFSASEKYFIKNGKPFFIFRHETVWNFDGGTPEKPITKDDITETRIYLENDKILKCLEKKYSIKSDSKEKTSPDTIPSKETQCNADEVMKTYQSLLRNKDKKGEIKCL